MKIVRTVKALRSELKSCSQFVIGFVPTMGALHEGHLDLVRSSVSKCDFTVVSIFVNPTQFGKGEDLDKYPRQLKEDAELLQSVGADLIFAPDANKFYAKNHQSWIRNEELENRYCGKYRPGHFRGVLTVVAKLFQVVNPQFAFFGKKDYQQVFMIQKMVQDLDFLIKIKALPTRREKDGLAMSSRNAYLSKQERQESIALYRGLKNAKVLRKTGENRSSELKKCVKASFRNCKNSSIQYVEVVSRKTLLPIQKVEEPACILLACYVGKTRLIDNIEI